MKTLSDHVHVHKKFHFDNEHDVHMSSEIHGESGYGIDLKLVTILYWLRVSYPLRIELVGRSYHLRSFYLCTWFWVFLTAYYPQAIRPTTRTKDPAFDLKEEDLA